MTDSEVGADAPAVSEAFRDNARRHQQNLDALTASLRAVGIDESLIAAGVGRIKSSYADELARFADVFEKAGPDA